MLLNWLNFHSHNPIISFGESEDGCERRKLESSQQLKVGTDPAKQWSLGEGWCRGVGKKIASELQAKTIGVIQ